MLPPCAREGNGVGVQSVVRGRQGGLTRVHPLPFREGGWGVRFFSSHSPLWHNVAPLTPRSLPDVALPPPVPRRVRRTRRPGRSSLASAIDPIKRPSDKPDLKLSLAAYSFRQFLDLKKPTMTLFEFIDFAAELPLDAVELTSYFWAEQTDAYAEKLKAHAAKKKLAISGVPVGNNFCVKDDAKYKKQIQ